MKQLVDKLMFHKIYDRGLKRGEIEDIKQNPPNWKVIFF